jgi:aminoglycoside phosphotransferase (APT) family kinase protein
MPVPNLIERDHISADEADRLRLRYPTERETEQLLARRTSRRGLPSYVRPTLTEFATHLRRFLDAHVDGGYALTDLRWFTGGVSKIQMGFSLEWTADGQARRQRMVARMEPAESLNATSRVREFELLRAFVGTIPVPETFWVDGQGEWFPEPSMIYAYADGVTKPSGSTTGQVTGLGTSFGHRYRELLAPQFMSALGAIHTFDISRAYLSSMDVPSVGSPDAALWQLNRARRVWEEDRGEDFPLMELAGGWLERNAPALDQVSVVHGDFRSGNFLFDEPSGKITAWLDWERGHLGDRHRDLAWTTQSTFGHWDESGKQYLVCGLVPLDEFYDEYEKISGLPVDLERLQYYRILNSYQIVVALLGTAFRVVRLNKSHQGLLIARLRGQVASVADDLAILLDEVL